MDNQYTEICPSSYFHFLFAKSECRAGQYRVPPSSLHTAPPKKLLYSTHTQTKSKRQGEASQTTANSKWSRFKKEMGNTTCLEVAFACAAQPSSTGIVSRIFTASSSVWKLSKYLLNPWAADWGLLNPWTFILSFKPSFPFLRCYFAP